jgi:copper homeostasis protein CutC
MAGAGINPENVSAIINTGVKEIHLSGRKKKEKLQSIGIRMGQFDDNLEVTDEEIIRMVRSKLHF